MFLTLTVLASIGATTLAGYSGSSSNSVGNGYGYGFSGSYGGNGGNIPGNIPVPQFNFEGALGGYLDSLKKYHEQFINNGGSYSYAQTSSAPNSNVQAQSSVTYSKAHKKTGIQQQATSGAGAGYAGAFPSYVPSSAGAGNSYQGAGGGNYDTGSSSSFGGGYSGNGGGAVASASIDPSGGYQTAAVYPENPNIPNIFNRFAEVVPQGGHGGGGGGGGDGSFGVFTSSVSSSSNVNGQPQNFHRASTTINDNGKVTTYTVKNP